VSKTLNSPAPLAPKHIFSLQVPVYQGIVSADQFDYGRIHRHYVSQNRIRQKLKRYIALGLNNRPITAVIGIELPVGTHMDEVVIQVIGGR
jgi:hypothetical protein